MIGLRPVDPKRFQDPVVQRLLETFAAQAAVALKRAMLAERTQREQVEIEAERLVTDRGPGLPPGEEARVFEKFHRAASGSVAGGSGLGLTICRGIVTAHGGRIWAENRAGGGAVFRFTLPFGGPPPRAVPAELAVE